MSHLDFYDVTADVDIQSNGRDTSGPTWNPWNRDLSDSHEPGLIYPGMDMSTALRKSSLRASSEASCSPITLSFAEEAVPTGDSNSHDRIDLAPKLYACSVKSSLLPCRQVQGELVTLYFRHIHPMLPAVDEHHFCTIHRNLKGQEELMKPGEFLIYLAILAAGFGHLTEIQLHRTPYRSLHDGQGALFDQVKERYWAATDIDPVLLTQAALIISLWSPAPPAPIAENNSYWLDLAFKHANTAKLWDPQKLSADSFCRRRVLWWCCIVRDRHLAVVLRRPYRLHNIIATGEFPLAGDFGKEAIEPSFVDVPSKQLAMLSFTWFCHLSEIMARIASFQRQFRFSLDWSGTVDISSGFEEIYELDRQLEQWRSDFENVVSEEGETSTVAFSPSITLLRMISYSLVTVLYQFFFLLHRRDMNTGPGLEPDPLERIKVGSHRVAMNLEVFKMNDCSDDIPLWTLGWLVLPLIVYQVSEHMNTSLPLKDTLAFFMKKLARRGSGPQAISQTVSKVVKAVAEGASASSLGDSPSLTPDASTSDAGGAERASVLESARWKREAKILAISLSLCDPAIEHNAMPDQSKVMELC